MRRPANPRWAEWFPSGGTAALLVVGFALVSLLRLSPALGPYEEGLLTQTFLFAAMALAWNWLGGYVGQVSFGHAAMFGVGGFVAARLLTTGISFPLAVAIGGAAAGAYAMLWGHATLRLRGPYFAIATIGIGEATRLVATYWRSFTGGATGISLGAAAPKLGVLYWYSLALMAAAIGLSYYLRNARIGFALGAIRDDVDAAGDLGVSATRYQDLILLASSITVGLAGGLYAAYFSFIEPTGMLGFERSIGLVLMGTIGGIGTVLGPVLGAVVFVVVQEVLVASYPQLYLGFYGLLLIAVVLFEPLGLAGLLARLGRLLGYREKRLEWRDLGSAAVVESRDGRGLGGERARES
jgi:branched-chain amino acid transport system permease protein